MPHQSPSVLLAGTGFFLLLLCTVSCKKDTVPPDHTVYDVNDNLLLQLNALRAKGCRCGTDTLYPAQPVAGDSTLEKAAAAHAEDMLTRNYFSHLTPEGILAIQRARATGYTGDYVGEVIARNYYSTEAVIAAWKNSESHCKAMMDTLYNEAGAARVGDYWVMDLGRTP